jgi:hypothetical protein
LPLKRRRRTSPPLSGRYFNGKFRSDDLGRCFCAFLRSGGGPVAELVGIRVGVVSGVINLESSDIKASDWSAMKQSTTKLDSVQPATELAVDLFDNWFDPIETEVRARSRQFIEELIRGELDAALARPRYGRTQIAGNEAGADVTGHGSRTRSLTGTFGPIEIFRADG